MSQSLLQLSQAFHQGELTKETYRQYRMTLIDKLLSESEQEPVEVINNAEAGDEVVETPSGRSKRLALPITAFVVANVVIVTLVIVLGEPFFSADDENIELAADAADVEESTILPSKDYGQVLWDYTQAIIGDNKLDDGEIRQMNDLWDAGDVVDKQTWKENADRTLLQADSSGNQVLIQVLGDVYSDLDVTAPVLVAELELMNEQPETKIASVAPTVSMEVGKVVATAPEKPSQPDIQPAVVKVAESVPIVTVEPAVGESIPIVDEKIVSADDVVVLKAAEEVADVSSVTVVDVPLDVLNDNQTEIAPETDETRKSVNPGAIALIEVTAQSIPEPALQESDILSPFKAMQSADLATEQVIAFNLVWKAATRSEKLEFTELVPADEFKTMYLTVRDELTRFQYDPATPSTRNKKLLQLNRTLKALVSRTE